MQRLPVIFSTFDDAGRAKTVGVFNNDIFLFENFGDILHEFDAGKFRLHSG